MSTTVSLMLLALLLCSAVTGFISRPIRAGAAVGRVRLFAEGEAPSSLPPAPAAAPTTKGFGKPIEKKAEVIVEDAGTRTYASQAKRGVPEYNIFLRPTNGTETEWVPVGSMTIPRDTPVSKAVYDVEGELLKGTFKLFPKLKAYSDTRAQKEGMFEYGYCLKAFPDEEIKIIVKSTPETESGGFFQSWLNKITNPMDTQDLKSKDMTLRQ